MEYYVIRFENGKFMRPEERDRLSIGLTAELGKAAIFSEDERSDIRRLHDRFGGKVYQVELKEADGFDPLKHWPPSSFV